MKNIYHREGSPGVHFPRISEFYIEKSLGKIHEESLGHRLESKSSVPWVALGYKVMQLHPGGSVGHGGVWYCISDFLKQCSHLHTTGLPLPSAFPNTPFQSDPLGSHERDVCGTCAAWFWVRGLLPLKRSGPRFYNVPTLPKGQKLSPCLSSNDHSMWSSFTQPEKERWRGRV